MIRAVVSLGTNTVRLLIVRERDDGSLEEVEHAGRGTRLGQGLCQGGALAPDAVERTLAVVREFAERAQRHGAELATIATSAVRRAADRAAFARRMCDITGVELQILDGEREAAYTFMGATASAPEDGKRIAVVDVGGGSTECAVGTAGGLATARSVEIGSVALSERFPGLLGHAPAAEARAASLAARREAAHMLAGFAQLAAVHEVRSVAGTAATLAAVAAASDVERVAGTTLTRASLEETLERLLGLGLEERRRLPGMLPQRADILAGGAIVLCQTLDVLGAGATRVERNDLLLGFLQSAVAHKPARHARHAPLAQSVPE